MKIIVIVGPTGVGKTKMSIELAKKYNAEVINADSMQVYRDLNIGTSKIKKEEMDNVIHHLIDIKDVSDDYSVYDYQIDGRKILDKLIKEDKNVIVVGGTGLYIKALLYDYKFEKMKEYKDYSNLTNEELLSKILSFNNKVDVHVNNRKRLESLLNRFENDEVLSDNGDKLFYDNVYFIGLNLDRDVLYDNINKRVDLFFIDGLLEEAKYFYDRNIRSKAIMTGIGYKELYLYFDNEMSLDESINLIKKNSRHYAKRQYTWFNNKMDITWFNVDINNFNNTVDEVTNFIN